jgi:hypothetical protein
MVKNGSFILRLYLFAACRFLTGYQPSPGGEISPALEVLRWWRKGLNGQGSDGADAWHRHQSSSHFIFRCARPKLLFERFDLCLMAGDLFKVEPTQLPHRIRQARSRVVDRMDQLTEVNDALCRNDSILREMPTQGIHQLCSLSHQKVPGAKQHAICLLIFGFDGHEPHGRAGCSFGDGL